MRFPHLPVLASALLLLVSCIPVRAAEPSLRAGDVVTLLGGEEMVATSESGALELALLTRAPALHLTIRSLAWEGDTAYEQRRDLNYPTLPQQLAEIHATVVILQLGQMECLQGAARLQAFVAAFEKLALACAGEPSRRLILLLPHDFTLPTDESLPDLTQHNGDVAAYTEAIRALAQRHGWLTLEWSFSANSAVTEITRDGIHLNAAGEALRAQNLATALLPGAAQPLASGPEAEALLDLIRKKNRLWFNYYRPQNWAFLAGDRVNQPSSHDHLDPTKRWFPAEMEQYGALIAEKEHAIADQAASLATSCPLP